MNLQSVGKHIAELRKTKGITQSELGDRIGISFQAVSKWERGETLPDTSVLPALANVLETSIDFILLGGDRMTEFKGKCMVTDLRKGIECLHRAGTLLGNDNLIYSSAIRGINTTLNTDIEEAFKDEYIFEAFLAEAIIQNLKNGYYVDISDIKNNFKNAHFKQIVIDYCSKYGIT